MAETIKIAVGFIVYGELTAKYLPYFMPSLALQDQSLSGTDLEIFVADNSDNPDNDNRKFLAKEYPRTDIIHSGENIGFARAYNLLIAEAARRGARFFLTLNPDMRLQPGIIAKLAAELIADPALGSVAPKILKWDFDQDRGTGRIDSCGIALRRGLRFVDLGQGEEDDGRFDQTLILGPSGAAGMFRMNALNKIKGKEGYYDERMFMYKEDCDLAYRLKIAGFRSKLVPEAVIFHDRTAASTGEGNLRIAVNRKNKSRQVKAWSLFNQHLIFLKHWPTLGLFDKLAVVWYALKMFVYVMLFERYLLKQYAQLMKIKL